VEIPTNEINIAVVCFSEMSALEMPENEVNIAVVCLINTVILYEGHK